MCVYNVSQNIGYFIQKFVYLHAFYQETYTVAYW